MRESVWSPLPVGNRLGAQARVCQALGDPKRLKIVYLLREGERSVSEIVDATGVRQTNVSQHLATLRELGLVRARREANHVFYSLASPLLAAACDLVQELLNDLEAVASPAAVAARSEE